MYFTKFFSAAVLSALYVAGGVRADDCDDGPMNSHGAMGYPGKPSHFCHTKWKQGLVVTGMEVWATAWQIKGIQLTYSDGTKAPLEGQAYGDRHDSIYWDAATPISVMKLAVNYAGDGLGLVHIEVGGKTLDVRSDTGSFNGDNTDVASGLLLGASGDSGGFVTAWAPLFMGISNGKAEIVDIKFNDSLDDVNKKQKGIQTMTLDSQYIKNTEPINATDADQKWEYRGEQKVTTSTTLSSTSEKMFSMSESISISATIGFPEVADVSVSSTTEFGYQMSNSETTEKSNSYETTVGTTQGSTDTVGLIKPGHAKNCTTTAVQGKYNGGYTATVKISVNGKDYTLQRPGTFEGISWVNGATECNDVLIKNIPKSANVVSAKSTVKRAVGFVA